MMTIDRNAPVPIHRQLADQLRFQITSGRQAVGSRMPSTRRLAKQLDISFHTVRKVFQELAKEGYLESRPGSGFVVRDRGPISKEHRMERGAAIAYDALVRMLSLGLNESEIEYLFQEQLSLIELEGSSQKIVFAAPYLEMAERCAAQLGSALQIDVEAETLARLSYHPDADVVLVRFTDLNAAVRKSPTADVLGVHAHLPAPLIESIARLRPDGTVGVVFRDQDAAEPLMHEIRTQTRFGGQMLAISIDERTDTLENRLQTCDVIVATPACRRRLQARLRPESKFYVAEQRLDDDSIRRIRDLIPG